MFVFELILEIMVLNNEQYWIVWTNFIKKKKYSPFDPIIKRSFWAKEYIILFFYYLLFLQTVWTSIFLAVLTGLELSVADRRLAIISLETILSSYNWKHFIDGVCKKDFFVNYFKTIQFDFKLLLWTFYFKMTCLNWQ